MLVKLKRPKSNKINDALQITDEQLQQISKELTELAVKMSKSKRGESNGIENAFDVLDQLNNMTIEAVLYATLMGMEAIAF